jgi:hypothetical protein
MEQNTPPSNETEAQRINRSLAEAAAAAEEQQADETTEGGQYKVGDQLVDANGEPVKEQTSHRTTSEESKPPSSRTKPTSEEPTPTTTTPKPDESK